MKTVQTSSRRRNGAFVLLEVMIAMTILALALTAVMKGFTIGLSTLRRNRTTAVGATLAQRLLEEYEIECPPEGYDEGHFGEEFPNFAWERTVTTEPVEYRDARMFVADNEPAEMFMVQLRILYYRDAESLDAPVTAIDIRTALTQFERFSKNTRLRGGIYPHEGEAGGRR